MKRIFKVTMILILVCALSALMLFACSGLSGSKSNESGDVTITPTTDPTQGGGTEQVSEQGGEQGGEITPSDPSGGNEQGGEQGGENQQTVTVTDIESLLEHYSEEVAVLFNSIP